MRKLLLLPWRNFSHEFTFRRLIKDFRNTNEHFDKIDSDLQYSLFESSVSIEKLEELYEVCNKIVYNEIKVAKDDDLPGLLLANAEIESSYHNMILSLLKSNEKEKDNNPIIFCLNNEMIELFQNINFASLDSRKLDKICSSLFDYINDESIKKDFIQRYGDVYYNEFLSLLTDDDISIEDYTQRFNDLLGKIMQIEMDKNKVC